VVCWWIPKSENLWTPSATTLKWPLWGTMLLGHRLSKTHQHTIRDHTRIDEYDNYDTMAMNFLFELVTSDTAKPVARIIFDGFTLQKYKTWHHLTPFSCAFAVHFQVFYNRNLLVVNCNDPPFMKLSFFFAVANAEETLQVAWYYLMLSACCVSWTLNDLNLELYLIHSDSLPPAATAPRAHAKSSDLGSCWIYM